MKRENKELARQLLLQAMAFEVAHAEVIGFDPEVIEGMKEQTIKLARAWGYLAHTVSQHWRQ